MPKTFVNESTYKNYLENGKEQEFDQLFDDAVKKAKASFSNQRGPYPIYIADKEIYAKELLQEKSPIDSTILGSFQKGTREHAQQAVSEALNAFKSWSMTDYRERAAIFAKAAGLLSQRKFDMAAILSYENGKSRYESIGEVDEGDRLHEVLCKRACGKQGLFKKDESRSQSSRGVESRASRVHHQVPRR